MNQPFDQWPIDGTDSSVFKLVIVDQLYLRRVQDLIALRLESPLRESTGERTVQQWGLTGDQARFLIETLQECLKEPDDPAR